MKRDWQLFIMLLGLSLLMFLPGLGSFGIIDPSDGYYSEGAREMLEANNFLTPTLNYQPWFEKPILAYWLIIGSYKLFGVNEFAARVPAALSAICLILFLYLVCRQFLRRRAALFSALILLTSPLFITLGHLSLTDMPFSTFVTVSLLSFFSVLRKPSMTYLFVGYIALALAILCKGPLGLILPGLAIVLYILFTNKLNCRIFDKAARLNPFAGAFLTGVLALPWYIAETIVTKYAFAREFFLKQNAGRLAGTANHYQPYVWFYLPYIFIGAAPWSFLYLSQWKQIYRSWLYRYSESRRAQILFFTNIWFLAFFILFSLVPTKLPTYILPTLPPLAIIIGTNLDTMCRLKLNSNWFRTKTYMAFACMLIGTIALTPIFLQMYYHRHESGFNALLERSCKLGANLAIIGPSAPSANFYLHRVIPVLKTNDEVANFNKIPQAHHLIIVHQAQLSLCHGEKNSMRTVDHQGKWYLMSAE